MDVVQQDESRQFWPRVPEDGLICLGGPRISTRERGLQMKSKLFNEHSVREYADRLRIVTDCLTHRGAWECLVHLGRCPEFVAPDNVSFVGYREAWACMSRMATLGLLETTGYGKLKLFKITDSFREAVRWLAVASADMDKEMQRLDLTEAPNAE